jgi:hypothetical protein
MDPVTVRCRACSYDVELESDTCPHCGADQPAAAVRIAHSYTAQYRESDPSKTTATKFAASTRRARVMLVLGVLILAGCAVGVAVAADGGRVTHVAIYGSGATPAPTAAPIGSLPAAPSAVEPGPGTSARAALVALLGDPTLSYHLKWRGSFTVTDGTTVDLSGEGDVSGGAFRATYVAGSVTGTLRGTAGGAVQAPTPLSALGDGAALRYTGRERTHGQVAHRFGAAGSRLGSAAPWLALVGATPIRGADLELLVDGVGRPLTAMLRVEAASGSAEIRFTFSRIGDRIDLSRG